MRKGKGHRITEREKLIELIGKKQTFGCIDLRDPNVVWRYKTANEELADYLLDNGVTFATGTNDGGKWISVEDRLPENGVWVMAYQDCGWIGVSQIEEDGWHWYTQDLVKLSDPTHWMPLPEPPKEE